MRLICLQLARSGAAKNGCLKWLMICPTGWWISLSKRFWKIWLPRILVSMGHCKIRLILSFLANFDLTLKIGIKYNLTNPICKAIAPMVKIRKMTSTNLTYNNNFLKIHCPFTVIKPIWDLKNKWQNDIKSTKLLFSYKEYGEVIVQENSLSKNIIN